MLAFCLILWLKANSYNFEIKEPNPSDPGHLHHLYVVNTNFKVAKLNKGWEAPLPIEQAQGTLQGAELYNVRRTLQSVIENVSCSLWWRVADCKMCSKMWAARCSTWRRGAQSALNSATLRHSQSAPGASLGQLLIIIMELIKTISLVRSNYSWFFYPKKCPWTIFL